MSDYRKISIKFSKEIPENQLEKIYNHFVSKDYDFPKECLNGIAYYRQPSLESSTIINDLYEIFNIDDAKLLFYLEDSDENPEICTYKLIFWKKLEKKKFYDFISNLISTYNINNLCKVNCSLSIKKNWKSELYDFHFSIFLYFTFNEIEYSSYISHFDTKGISEINIKIFENVICKFAELLHSLKESSFKSLKIYEKNFIICNDND